MQRNDVLERIGKFGAVSRLAPREPHCLRIVGQRQVIVRARKKRPIGVAVVADAANRDPGEGHAVITLLASDQAKAAALPDLVEIGARDLERRIARLRAGVDQEHMVEPFGRHAGELLRQRKCRGVRKLKGRGVVQLVRRARNRLGDRFASMTRIHAPQTGAGIEQRAPALVVIVHAVCAREHSRFGLEMPVGRKREPECGEVVRRPHAVLREGWVSSAYGRANRAWSGSILPEPCPDAQQDQ